MEEPQRVVIKPRPVNGAGMARGQNTAARRDTRHGASVAEPVRRGHEQRRATADSGPRVYLPSAGLLPFSRSLGSHNFAPHVVPHPSPAVDMPASSDPSFDGFAFMLELCTPDDAQGDAQGEGEREGESMDDATGESAESESLHGAQQRVSQDSLALEAGEGALSSGLRKRSFAALLHKVLPEESASGLHHVDTVDTVVDKCDLKVRVCNCALASLATHACAADEQRVGALSKGDGGWVNQRPERVACICGSGPVDTGQGLLLKRLFDSRLFRAPSPALSQIGICFDGPWPLI